MQGINDDYANDGSDIEFDNENDISDIEHDFNYSKYEWNVRHGYLFYNFQIFLLTYIRNVIPHDANDDDENDAPGNIPGNPDSGQEPLLSTTIASNSSDDFINALSDDFIDALCVAPPPLPNIDLPPLDFNQVMPPPPPPPVPALAPPTALRIIDTDDIAAAAERFRCLRIGNSVPLIIPFDNSHINRDTDGTIIGEPELENDTRGTKWSQFMITVNNPGITIDEWKRRLNKVGEHIWYGNGQLRGWMGNWNPSHSSFSSD